MINKSVLKLINAYFWKGFFGPFFSLVFPILLIFILGNVFYDKHIPIAKQRVIMQNLAAGIMISTVLSIGIFSVPTTIIEFKKSTLIKRVGAAQISKSTFIITILFYNSLWLFVLVFYNLLWFGILVGTKGNVGWSTAFPKTLIFALPFIIIAFIMSISIGMLILSFANTVQSVMGISNLVYIPIAFLSGSFFPKEQIDNSSILNSITYMLPTKYIVDPFFAVWNNGKAGLVSMGYQSYLFPIIAILLVISFLAISIKKFKWGD